MIILYNKRTGDIIGVDHQPELAVRAWLSDPANAEIAEETGYLVYDDGLALAEDIARDGPRGRFYVEGDILYENGQWGGE